MEILAILTAGETRNEEDYESIAAKRRTISTDDLTKVGTVFEKTDSEFQSVVKHVMIGNRICVFNLVATQGFRFLVLGIFY